LSGGKYGFYSYGIRRIFCYRIESDGKIYDLPGGSMNNQQNSHAIEVLACSATDLLQGLVKIAGIDQPIYAPLSIPEYQRPYCWQDQQLDQLLSDLKAHNSNEKTGGLDYYLGSLVLHYDGTQLNIIDGQQRVTTIGLLAFTLGYPCDISLTFESPLSQQQIKHNFSWLNQRVSKLKDTIDFTRMMFTLVITRSQDDAYLFLKHKIQVVCVSVDPTSSKHIIYARSPARLNDSMLKRGKALANYRMKY
jgi:hypothetical protein